MTPGLVRVGRHRYPSEDVGTIDALVKERRSRYGGVIYREWSLAITMLSMHTIRMTLQRGGSDVPAKVNELVVAVNAMLAAKQAPVAPSTGPQ